MKDETQVIKKRRDRITDAQNLMIAYSAEVLTREKYEKLGYSVEPFLGTFLKTGKYENFTRDYGIRDIMSNIKVEDIKKELFILLYAHCHYIEPHLTQVFNKGKGPNYKWTLNKLFENVKLDAKNYEKIFNHLIDNYPEVFNAFIDEKLEEIFRGHYDKKNFITNNFNFKNSYIYDGYLDINNRHYDEELLKTIHEFENPKKRLKVISTLEINKYTKSLKF